MTLRAQAQHAGRLGVPLPGEVDATEDEVLRTYAHTIAVVQGCGALDLHPVDADAVAAAHVFHALAALVDHDPGVLPGHQRILDREVAVQAAPDHGRTVGQVEFLEEKPQSVSRHLAPVAAAPDETIAWHAPGGQFGTALAREAPAR